MEILHNIMLLFIGQCLNMIIFRKEIFGNKEKELEEKILELRVQVMRHKTIIDFQNRKINELKGGK